MRGYQNYNSAHENILGNTPQREETSQEAGGWGQERAIERRCALEQTVSWGIVRVSTCWFVLLALCREVAMLFLLATHLCLLCNF